MAASENHLLYQPAIEADNETDHDSALGDDISTYTSSLKSTLLQSVVENSRGYHKYHDGAYLLPEDEREQNRLDLQHEMMLKAFNRKLLLAPVEPENMRHVLDLGTGTGLWAIDFADKYPDCQVLGIDLSPIQPAFIPLNCKFEVDDWESDWPYRQRFDVIHGRMMMSSMEDPQGLFAKAYRCTSAGGWFELQDVYMPILSDDGTITKDSALHRWNELTCDGISKMGRSARWATRYQQWMEQSGFVNVQQTIRKIPINSWPKDRFMKELGAWNLINMLEGLEGFCSRLFTKIHGMTKEEIDVLLMDVRKDLCNKAIHSYWVIYVVYGQKPSDR